MSYLPEKKSESEMMAFAAITSEKMKRRHEELPENEMGKILKIMMELLTKEERKLLFEFADSKKKVTANVSDADNDLDSNFWCRRESFDKEKLLKDFRFKVWPAIITKDVFPDDDVRCDFLRYFILCDNFAAKRPNTFSPTEYFFEAFNGELDEKINNFSNISKLYEFAADRILFYGDLRPTVEEEDHLWCFVYEMSIGLVYNNTDFLKIALDKKKLTFTTYIKLLRLLAKEGKPRPDKKLSDDLYRINTMPNIVGFYGLRNEMIKKRHVEIIFSNIEEVKKFLEDSKGYNSTKKNQEFFAVVTTLDPEYEMKIIQLIIENDVKKDEFIDIKYDRDLFTKSWLISVISIDNYDFPCFDEEKDKKKFDEILLLILKIFLHEKVFKNESFKRLPEFFKNMVVIEQIRSVYGKADVLPELGLDKEKLKKEADKFFAELKKIAKNGGKPSDYYAGEYFESDKISDPESYLTSLVFQTAVSFVQDSFGAWKAVKPMLAIFRNLKEQAYSIGMKSSDYGCYPWDFVSIRLTELLGALDLDKDNVEEKEKVCEEWFNHIAKQLSSADETEVKKREENPETVPEKFKDGYDIKTVEAHPLWREVFCNAAKELGVHPIFEKYKVFNYLKKNDIDREVRAAAAETFDSIEEISGKFKSGSKKLLKALWCYKIAHLISLDIDVEDADIPSIELTSNYKKYFEVPKLPNVKSQS